jgi:GWxTD domain-containing protein
MPGRTSIAVVRGFSRAQGSRRQHLTACRNVHACVVFAGALLLPVLISAVLAGSPDRDWAETPEAYFLTRDEHAEWKTLRSREEREQFQARYWRRRDPAPDTPRNEFRELILSRIEAADARFGVEAKPGSRTARGMVLIVFGPPDIERQTVGPLDRAPKTVFPGQLAFPRGLSETTEWHVWVYNGENTAELLEALERRRVEISFVIERGRGDHLQNSGPFYHYRDTIARQSIVQD